MHQRRRPHEGLRAASGAGETPPPPPAKLENWPGQPAGIHIFKGLHSVGTRLRRQKQHLCRGLTRTRTSTARCVSPAAPAAAADPAPPQPLPRAALGQALDLEPGRKPKQELNPSSTPAAKTKASASPGWAIVHPSPLGVAKVVLTAARTALSMEPDRERNMAVARAFLRSISGSLTSGDLWQGPRGTSPFWADSDLMTDCRGSGPTLVRNSASDSVTVDRPKC